jgi:cobalt/nickel transport system permease protein
MHIHFLDPYRAMPSPVHALDARVKLVLTLGFVLTCSLTPLGSWPVYILLLAVLLSVEILSGLGPLYVIKRSALALPFALAALPVLFTTPGQTIFSIANDTSYLAVSAEGLTGFTSILLKSWLSVQGAIVLAASTRFPQLLQAMRAIRVPRLLVALFSLMWRYLFVFGDEALRLTRARSARSGAPAGTRLSVGGSMAWRARVVGGMAGSLLVRAFERSERIYGAMLARGYDGEVRSLALPGIAFGEWFVLGVGLALFLLLVLFGALL